MGIYNKNYDIDHKDRNKLNDKRENLRRATRGQNNVNSTICRSNTGYRNISFREKDQRYGVYIKFNKMIFSRNFKILEEAIKYRNLLYEKIYKEFNPLD